jgi:uncharacterized protein (UPF0333 family)
MSKKLLLFLIIILIAIFYVFYSFNVDKKNNDNLTLILDYGNQTKQSFKLSTTDSYKAWSLLQQISAVYNIRLEPTNNFYPQRIDGLSDGSNNKHWNFYVNGKKQEKSPIETVVAPPAEIVFRFE